MRRWDTLDLEITRYEKKVQSQHRHVRAFLGVLGAVAVTGIVGGAALLSFSPDRAINAADRLGVPKVSAIVRDRLKVPTARDVSSEPAVIATPAVPAAPVVAIATVATPATGAWRSDLPSDAAPFHAVTPPAPSPKPIAVAPVNAAPLAAAPAAPTHVTPAPAVARVAPRATPAESNAPTIVDQATTTATKGVDPYTEMPATRQPTPPRYAPTEP